MSVPASTSHESPCFSREISGRRRVAPGPQGQSTSIPGLAVLRIQRGTMTRSPNHIGSSAEAPLSEPDVRYRIVFERSNDAIFVVDVEADAILDVNPKACQMLGYSREELRSVPMSAIHPEEMDQVRTFAETVRREGSSWTNELSCMMKDGRVRNAEISGSLLGIDDRTCMIAIVRDVTERDRLRSANRYLAEDARDARLEGEIRGEGLAFQTLKRRIELVAEVDSTVVIAGESGTGKELVARAIHERSTRRDRPLVRVNCASVPKELFESEFFGHAKGAFTGATQTRIGRFEAADQGTLFLDEVGEVPLELQSKLLRVIQEGVLERVGEIQPRSVNVRLIAATNRDLEQMGREGTFRRDLYYRLNVFPVRIVPLREASEDIETIARGFLATRAPELGVPVPDLTAEHVRQLRAYSWPGNVRELQNVLERALILSKCGAFTLRGALPDQRSAEGAAADDPIVDPSRLDLEAVKELERAVIERALEAAGGKIYGDGGAAQRLRIPASTLASRLKSSGLKG